jgi:hypothetical protein
MDGELNTIQDEGELEEVKSVKSPGMCIVDPNLMRLQEQTIKMLY